MRYIGLLIEQAGRESHNPREQATSTAGISDNTFIEWANYAQDRLQTILLRNIPHLTIFDARRTESVVSGTSAYDIAEDSDAMYDFFVRRVEYRSSSREEDYYELQYENERNLSLQTADYPSSYTIRGNQVVISPIPTSTGTLRITYVQALKRLDKRRGKIETINTSGSTYTSLVLEDTDDLDSDALATAEYVCVVSRFGNSAQLNIVVDSWDAANRTLTLSGSTVSDGVISVGDYITIGRYTTTHSSLPRKCERYLISYMSWKALKHDSSIDSAEQNAELLAIEEDILATFATGALLDVRGVPVLDLSWFE